jgi:hypothetical protein
MVDALDWDQAFHFGVLKNRFWIKMGSTPIERLEVLPYAGR